MIVLMKVLQVILALSILIVIHELGHFIFAKMFKIRVDKFYLFFDAGDFRLFSTKHNKLLNKLFPKLKDAETDYGIGWLPLGGYCKICGMIDESVDTGFLKTEPKEWEFRSKPAWQRLLTMAGGVLFNFIFAIILYIGILAGWGESYISNENSRIYVNELAYDMGFRNGDRILKFDDYVPERFEMLQADLARQTAERATLLRDGDTVNLYIDQKYIGDILKSYGMFDLAIPFVVDTVPPSSVNAAAGLLKGDRIVTLDGKAVDFVQDSRQMLKENAGMSVRAGILRDGDTLEMNLQVDTTGKLGIYTQFPGVETRDYSVIEAIPAGFCLTFSTIGDYLRDLKLVFTPSTEAYKSVGSFIAMGQIFPSNWDWYRFINILALLSIMLGVMNLIPIPALDGGHIVFIFYEMITGRKPNEKFLIGAQIVGMILLLGLMILAFGNDISRLIR